jgi:hypothetical protein
MDIDYTYSIYNLSLISETDLLSFNIDCIENINKYYKCNNDIYKIIIDEIIKLKNTIEFNIWSNEYYSECILLERFLKNINENNINKPIKYYNCNYCKSSKTKKELKKCAKCKLIYYCSFACQIRDWNNTIEPHKSICIDYELDNELDNELDTENVNETNNYNRYTYSCLYNS